MASYTLNSIDSDGNANVDVTIGDTTYNQDVILPTDPVQLQAKMSDYVITYAQELVQVPADPTPAPVKAMIGVVMKVNLDAATESAVTAQDAARAD